MSADVFSAVASSGIHVILGDAAAGTFRVAFKMRDRLLIDQDVLSCGPTPRCDDLELWREIRGAFWRNLVPDLIDQHTPSPANLVVDSARLREAQRILIWTATGVSEQLFVAFVCHLARLMEIDPERVWRIQFEHVPNRRSVVRGTGELDEERMRLHPYPTPLAPDEFASYLGAWDALTSPDPRDIERFSERHPTGSRWLQEALRLMLRRFPDRSTGLPYWDFKLLANVRRRGPDAARVIAYTIGEDLESGDIVGDWYLFGRLLRMADERLPEPLLTCSGNRRNMRDVKVALTRFGEDVLTGQRANHAANPLEDSIVGVKLSSAANALWFREGDSLVGR